MFPPAFLSEWLQFPREEQPENWAADASGSRFIESTSPDEIIGKSRDRSLRFSRAGRQAILIRHRQLEARDTSQFPSRVSAWFAKSGGAHGESAS
jgi:hypothetical protein